MKIDIRPYQPGQAKKLIKPENVGRYAQLRQDQDNRIAGQYSAILQSGRNSDFMNSMKHTRHINTTSTCIRSIEVMPEKQVTPNLTAWRTKPLSTKQREKAAKKRTKKGKAA